MDVKEFQIHGKKCFVACLRPEDETLTKWTMLRMLYDLKDNDIKELLKGSINVDNRIIHHCFRCEHSVERHHFGVACKVEVCACQEFRINPGDHGIYHSQDTLKLIQAFGRIVEEGDLSNPEAIDKILELVHYFGEKTVEFIYPRMFYQKMFDRKPRLTGLSEEEEVPEMPEKEEPDLDLARKA